jgi:opacity protein-like surface antigen
MKSMRIPVVLVGLALLSAVGAAHASGTEVAVLGGVQVLNQNDTAFPDRFVNVPAVATLSYHVTPILAVDGEFTWMIPVQQSVNLGAGQSQDRKTPNILAYQANLRANWPGSTAWSPYVAGGAGALTVLSQTDADRLPQIDKSQTMFAVNFGAGVHYGLAERWALRADFREFVAFPSNDAQGLSDSSGADPIWMERGALGIAYRF